MTTSRIIEELRIWAAMNLEPNQKAWFEQRAKDAKPVQCVRMRDVFNAEQLYFINHICGYHVQRKMCYRNAAELVNILNHNFRDGNSIRYVEGFAWNLVPIEHAFVKVNDVYIDPTFERALHIDVRKEQYVSCIELEPKRMAKYQVETGYYGDLYLYDYALKYDPEMAKKIRAMNPHNQ